MNISQALSELRKLWGKTAAISDSKRPSSPEQREIERAEHKRLAALKADALAASEARRAAILAADAEYQALKADYSEKLAALQRAPWGHDYRYSGGTSGSMFFTIKAEADTLAELVEKAKECKR